MRNAQAGRGPKAGRGSVKHVQQTRVADADGREKSTARGKAQKITEKKEARPNVKKRVGMQQKGAENRRPQ
jgi:hypothetical protein